MPDSTGRQPIVTDPSPSGRTGLGSDSTGPELTPGADRVIVEVNTARGVATRVDAAPHAPAVMGDTGKGDALHTERLDPATAEGARLQHEAAASATSDPAFKTVQTKPA